MSNGRGHQDMWDHNPEMGKWWENAVKGALWQRFEPWFGIKSCRPKD